MSYSAILSISALLSMPGPLPSLTSTGHPNLTLEGFCQFPSCSFQHLLSALRAAASSHHTLLSLKPFVASQDTWNNRLMLFLSSKALCHLLCLPPQGIYPSDLPSLTSSLFLHHLQVPVTIVSGSSQNAPHSFYFWSFDLSFCLLRICSLSHDWPLSLL